MLCVMKRKCVDGEKHISRFAISRKWKGESVGGRNCDATRKENGGHERGAVQLWTLFNSLVGSHQHGEFLWLL